MTGQPIRDVSDTAYWIAHHRAVESARPGALFRDPFAARLAGERGPKIAAAMPSQRLINWSVVIRTHIVDGFIRSAVARGADTVLNLGAGFDTRPYRMDLPPSLLWLEADYPRIIEYKAGLLAGEQPRCRLERVPVDLADLPRRRKCLADANARAGRLLVLSEGLVPYLTDEEAGVLADDLRALDRARGWIVDYFSPDAMKFRQRSGMAKRMANAPFRFNPPDPLGFFAARGWRVGEIRYLTEEGDRLRRPFPAPPLMRAAAAFWSLVLPRERIERMRRFSGYMLLEPAERAAPDSRKNRPV